MGMEPAQAFAAAVALTAGLCGFYATACQFVRVWQGGLRRPQSVREERDAFRRKIRREDWVGGKVVLALAVIAALVALLMFAPLAAMFVFPRGDALGCFLGGLSAFGVLLGVRHLAGWLQEKFV